MIYQKPLASGSILSTLLFFPDGGPSTKARVCEDTSMPVARRFHPRINSSLLIDIVIRLLNLYGHQLNGAHSQAVYNLYFFHPWNLVVPVYELINFW